MGEFDLLARLRDRLPPPGSGVILGSGDDAAITVPAGATATSVDALVEGVHFRRGTSSLRSIGYKAMATALSDLAAMGATPGEAYVVIGVPRDLDEDGCLEVLDGLVAVAGETGTTLAGGDVTRAGGLTLTVTVVGHAAIPERFVRRSGARPGDALVLSGELGGAAAGLLLLEDSALAEGLDSDVVNALRLRQTEPRPRLAAGLALAGAGATALIDISDGLGADAGHLARASEVDIAIEAEDVPVAAGVEAVADAAGREGLDLALGGGEDYELLAAVPPERVEGALEALEAAGTSGAVIGAAREGSGVVEVRRYGDAVRGPAGFDHLGL